MSEHDYAWTWMKRAGIAIIVAAAVVGAGWFAVSRFFMGAMPG